jgi:hypothetical protein
MTLYQKRLPCAEAVKAWAAAAGTAGAFMPPLVAKQLLSWEENEWCTPLVLEAVAVAAAQANAQNDGHFPPPRGMQVGVAPSGHWTLIWESDSHAITLQGGWSMAALLEIEVTSHEAPALRRPSPRVAAAVAASPTLQQEGWGHGHLIPAGAVLTY